MSDYKKVELFDQTKKTLFNSSFSEKGHFEELIFLKELIKNNNDYNAINKESLVASKISFLVEDQISNNK